MCTSVHERLYSSLLHPILQSLALWSRQITANDPRRGRSQNSKRVGKTHGLRQDSLTSTTQGADGEGPLAKTSTHHKVGTKSLSMKIPTYPLKIPELAKLMESISQVTPPGATGGRSYCSSCHLVNTLILCHCALLQTRFSCPLESGGHQ